MKEKETKNEYEFKHLRICEKWLQRASCSKCLFEVLCHLEKNKKENDMSIRETSMRIDWTE